MSDLTLTATLIGDAGPLNAALQSGGQSVAKFTSTVEASGKAADRAGRETAAAAEVQGRAARQLSVDEQAAAALSRTVREAEKRAMQDLRAETNLLRNAQRQLPMQVTDIVTSISSGMPVWMVAIQQGGQLRDAWGGVAPAGRALLGLLTPLRLAIGGVAVVAGLLAKGMYDGYTETVQMEKQLALLGPTAGRASGGVRQLAEDVASQTRSPIGGVRELVSELLNVSAVAGPALAEGTRAAVALQRLTGQTAKEVASQFASLGGDVVAWAAKANASYSFLTLAQYEQVRALQVQGRSAEATRLVLTELAATLESRSVPAVGYLERALNAASSAWSSFYDWLKAIGREETAEERIKALREQLDGIDKGSSPFQGGFLEFLRFSVAGPSAGQEILQGVRERIAGEERALREQANRDALRRSESKAAAIKVQDDIEKLSAGHQSALYAIAKAGSDRLLAQQQLGLSLGQQAYEAAFQRNEITARAYQDAMLAIDKARVDAQIQGINRQMQAERGRAISKPEELLQQQAALLALEAQRTALLERRAKLLADEARGLRDIVPKAESLGGRDALLAFKSQDERNVDNGLQERRDAARAAQQDLAAQNRAASIALIRDERQRGDAQIAMDELVLRQRLDLASLGAEERKRVEEDLAIWRVNRERQLTEQLKPEWQRMLEAWADAGKATERVVVRGVESMADALTRFAMTGKADFKGLANSIIADLIRIQIRQQMVQAMGGSSSGSGWLGSLITTGIGWLTGGSSAPSGFGNLDVGGDKTGRAAGGPVQPYTDYWVGEKGPELLRMGSQGGTVVPNHALSGTQGPLNVTLINQTGTEAEASARRRPDGGIEILLRAAKAAIADDIASGRGEVTSAMRSRFGLRDALV